MIQYLSFLLMFLVLGTGFAGVTEARAAAVPTSIVISSGKDQSGTVGTTLAKSFTVVLRDSAGHLVSGAQVDWQVTSGGGSLQSKTTFTNSSGTASTKLTLGKVPQLNKATAVIHGRASPVIFGAVANPGPAETIGAYSGNWQTGTVGSPVPTSLAAICRDKYGNPSSHAQVDWSVGSGGGSIPYSYSLTQSGIATKVLTLGTKPGKNTAVATIHGTGRSFTFNVTANAGAATAIRAAAGNNQTGSANRSLSSPFIVSVEDKYGNPRSGIRVNWDATTGKDAFSATTSTTDSSGRASSTLKLGSIFGLHRATATIASNGVSRTFTATEGVNAVVTVSRDTNPNPKALQPRFLGLSYEKSWITEPYFNEDNAALISLFKMLGPGVLRIVAERPHIPVKWKHNGPGLEYGTVSAKDLDRVAGFLKATNWKILYGIALVSNKAACSSGETACAADEAAAASKAFGSSLMGFEIGNEPDQYHKAVYGNPPTPEIPGYTWEDYISKTPVYSNGKLLPSWPAFANAIRAAVPDAKLTGPTTGYVWNMAFAKSDQASKVSLLTRHFYHSHATSSPTMDELLTPDPRVAEQFPELAQAAAAAKIGGGFRVSECNSFSHYTPGVTDGFGAALWTIDFLFANAFYQSTGVEFHGGADDPDSFTPLHDNGRTVTSIGADYYGLFAYAMIAHGGELLTSQVTPAPSTFSAYGVQQTNGSTDVILSNKDPDHDITVSITRPGTTNEATSLLMTAHSLSSTRGFELGGSEIGINGNWEARSNPELTIKSNSAVVTVPAGSAQIVHMH